MAIDLQSDPTPIRLRHVWRRNPSNMTQQCLFCGEVLSDVRVMISGSEGEVVPLCSGKKTRNPHTWELVGGSARCRLCRAVESSEARSSPCPGYPLLGHTDASKLLRARSMNPGMALALGGFELFDTKGEKILDLTRSGFIDLCAWMYDTGRAWIKNENPEDWVITPFLFGTSAEEDCWGLRSGCINCGDALGHPYIGTCGCGATGFFPRTHT